MFTKIKGYFRRINNPLLFKHSWDFISYLEHVLKTKPNSKDEINDNLQQILDVIILNLKNILKQTNKNNQKYLNNDQFIEMKSLIEKIINLYSYESKSKFKDIINSMTIIVNVLLPLIEKNLSK